jgi:hypothetical protein
MFVFKLPAELIMALDSCPEASGEKELPIGLARRVDFFIK